MTTLALRAGQDHLEKVASTRDPIKALSEFVWNAVDADAKTVSVDFRRNALGGIDSIVIGDDGVGISRERARDGFGRLGESWKRDAAVTGLLGRAVHGKEGRGRLRFYSLAQKADWRSVRRDGEGRLTRLSISIDAGSLDKCDVTGPEPEDGQSAEGTTVELHGLKASFDRLPGEAAFSEFSVLFASYMLQYPDVAIAYDGRALDPRANVARSRDIACDRLIVSGRTIADLSLRVIEWKADVEGRRIFLGGEAGVVLASQAANVTAPGFAFSAYAYSDFFREMAEGNMLDLDDLGDPAFVQVMAYIRERLGDHFRERQAERSGGVIEDLKKAGAYPYEGEPRDEIERRERQVFDIATYAVSSYSRDFTRAETSLKRMTLTLLREALRRNPDSLSTILHAVVNLPKSRQDEFSTLLRRTELGNVIAASSLIAERVVTIEVLKGVVFDPRHRSTVKERGELDALIRDNTWIFGEGFHMTVPEAGLTKVMDRVSRELGGGGRKARVTKPDGRTGRVDSFLGRRVPRADAMHHEFLLVELKRPSIKVGRRELDQLEDYARAIREQPDFANTSTSWHFFLVTGDYGEDVVGRVTQKDRPRGLFVEHDNARIWIKTWAELIREAESRLHFIQAQLKIEVDGDEIEERIARIKASILREPSRGVSDAGGRT